MSAATRARRPRIAQLGFGRDSTDLADLALVVLAVLGALLALLTRMWPMVVIGALPSLAADLLRVERDPRLHHGGDQPGS